MSYYENLSLYNVSIRKIFNQNQLINEYAIINLAKIFELQSPRVFSWDAEEQGLSSPVERKLIKLFMKDFFKIH